MKRLVSIGLILLIGISSGLFMGYSAPKEASASIIDKIELIDRRTRTSKTYWLGETEDGLQRFAIDSSIGSIHYEEAGQWLEIDSDIVPSIKNGWDWEVEKGAYKLLIKSDTSVAVGKDDYWLGFRYEGFAYLDKSTNDYVILQTRQNVAPVVEGNKITWNGIFTGVNLEYIYGNDGFKENLYITQAARDRLANNPPSKFGLNNQTTYLVSYIQCDWQYAGRAELDGETINWNTDVETYETPINFWHPIKNKILAALPVDYGYLQAGLEFEPLKLNKRFIRAPDGKNYLLSGARVLDLNQFPTGTIVLDPTVEVSVVAQTDDCIVYNNASTPWLYSHTNANQFVGYYSATQLKMGGGMRSLNVNIPTGATIENGTVLTLVCRFARDATVVNTEISGELSATPATFSNLANYQERRGLDVGGANDDNRTVAIVSWNNIGTWATGSTYSSPEIKAIIQEIVDLGTWLGDGTDDIVLFWDDHAGSSTVASSVVREAASLDDTTYDPPLLHIEYTAGGGVLAPTVVTNAASSVEEISATLSGNMTATGGENPTHRGFWWDIDSSNPYANSWLESGNWSVGEFTHGVNSLTKGDLYYFIATANNTGGTGNGTEQIFLTKPDAPSAFAASTQNSTAISYTWANGGGRDTTLLRYNDSGYPPDPAIGTLSYNSTDTTHTIDGLDPGTQIWAWIRSWCTEDGLEQYSDATANFTDYTLPGDPSGMVAENATATSIDVRWTKGAGGDYTMVRRKTGDYPTGVTDGTQAYYNTGSDFSDTSLDKGTTYYYRAWSRDSDSGYYSASYTSASETTLKTAPTVTNASGATNIASTTARINGNLTDDGGESCNVTMFWGLTDGSDNATAWEHEVDKGSLSTGTFYESLSSLNVTTQYFYISRAINTEGTDWADTTANFTTLAEGTDLLPPTDFTATYVNENEVTLAWTPGAFAEFTMVRANYGTAPENIEQGYCVYYGAANTTVDNIVELNLRDATIHYSAWSENTTMSWSDDYATASVENLGMSDFIDAFLPLLIIALLLILALWQGIIIIYALVMPVCFVYGFVTASEQEVYSPLWVAGVAIGLLGLYFLYLIGSSAVSTVRKKK